jgi:hypothetical protein
MHRLNFGHREEQPRTNSAADLALLLIVALMVGLASGVLLVHTGPPRCAQLYARGEYAAIAVINTMRDLVGILGH